MDTRTLKPGELFVALPGERCDGHQHVEAAQAAGAGGAMVRRGTRREGFPLLEIDDPKKALTDLAAGHRARSQAYLVAVTGSTGKTTVKEMIADVLATQAPTARTRGNWNNDLGLPLSLLTLEQEHRYGVFELGMSHPGELAPLCTLLKPRAAVVTSVGPVHIEFFAQEEDIAREKASVVRAIKPGGLVVLPGDDPWFEVLRSYVKGRLLTTSMRGAADYQAVVGDALSFQVFERASGDRMEFQAPLPGDFIVRDALLAIALGRSQGVDWASIARAIAAYQPVGLRWHREEINRVLVINDAYNANPMSMRAALQAFARTPVSGRRWLVLGSMREMGDLARPAHLALGREIAQGTWAGLLALGREGAWIAEGAREAGWPTERACVGGSPAEAAEFLEDRTCAGDAVLLKASRGERLEDVVKAWRQRLGVS
jgi:UDP-N-acetylmuramoyl-tripeptide--D-alanyl-D-alanine ligase